MSKAIDLGLIELAANTARYPSEEPGKQQPGNNITKKLPWKTLKGFRVTTNASQTTLYEGNPRNFGIKDISDLLPLIKETGGNSQAVDARMVGNKIEVIAGSRRRECCIEAGFPLTVDIYEDMNDDDADYLAATENKGRKDINVITDSNYLRYKFLKKQSSDKSLTVEMFAKQHKMSRQTMQDRFAIAAVPKLLQNGAKQSDAWTLRQAIKLKTLWKKLSESGETEESLKANAKLKIPVTTPSMMLSQLELLAEVEKPVNNQTTIGVGEGSWVLKQDKKGKLKLTTSAPVTEAQMEQLVSFIQSLE
ncbi:ParB N-terminal domain-containing protein [Shewanella algae]|uniref:ParB N-terminal domain-containing protein n=1 Tax=Shewanella TaxID=22 RepID=UPI000B34444B|nr:MULTISPECIES: ParB N-terminal domain-containing protein [Shewanella]AYV11397.1 hypothetical protein EEY24_00035 [Shewanella algae]MBO2656093.1 ParB N-terminal domain-containing protein [Shewanella algae]QXN27527.1 ParB N-terminal domain-containing protein [Shewanella putrefaciens]